MRSISLMWSIFSMPMGARVSSIVGFTPWCSNTLGATADSTHFAGSIHTLPKGYRRIFTMKRYEVDFPLKHPRYVIENVAYKESVYRIMGWDHPWIKIGRSFEELFLNLKYGNFSIITKAVKNRINKWLKRNKHH